MEEKCIIDLLADLIQMPEKWMIQDDEGVLHELSSGVKGVPVMMNSRTQIYKVLFGRERVSINQLIMLDEINTYLMNFIWNNFSHKIRFDNQDEIDDIIEKYGMKKINRRKKK